MSDTFKIKFNNMSALAEVMSEIPKEFAKRAGIAALKKGAVPVLEEAKALVPVKSGTLRDSLEISPKKGTGDTAVVKVQASRKKGGSHAHLIELGTKAHDIPDAVIGNIHYDVIHHPGSSKQPFLRPALLNKKEETLKIVLENIAGEAAKQLKRALKK